MGKAMNDTNRYVLTT